MKKTIFFNMVILAFFWVGTCFAQVGIGTTTPNGALDINSSQYGVVYPSVALVATNGENPVTNPQSEGLAVGTTVYNTNTTNNGSFDVEPGIYSWNGTIWVRHYYKRQVEIFKQGNVLRSKSTGSYQVVNGFPIVNPKQFFAKYSGLYKIELRVDYGGGAMVDNDDVNVGLFEGDFKFTFNTIPYFLHAKSYSTFNQYIGTGTNFSNIPLQTSKTIYVNLVAGTLYDFSLEFNQFPDPDPDILIGYLGNGNNNTTYGDGRGYVGQDIPCTVEFTYLKE